jgi:hypothetical protein
MADYYIDKPDPTVRAIVQATFPGYRGKKFKLSTTPPSVLRSYWDGGSKTDYAFFCLPTQGTAPVATNHPFFNAGNPTNLPDGLPRGIVLVAHTISCGKDMGITIYANPADIAPMLPEKPALTEDECVVLTYTRSLKSSYAGVKNYRWQCAHDATGITEDRWNHAKQSLIAKALLRKNGAITPAGRNAIAS